MIVNDAPQSWPCELCRKPSVPRLHDGCAARLAENLAVIPQLYRDLEDVLQPGRHGVSSIRAGGSTPPLPVNERVLDLRARGGIEGVVTTWERDVREQLGWDAPPLRGDVQQTIDGAVLFLQNNLHWMLDAHPAVFEFKEDVRRLRAECEAMTTGEKPPRRIPVQCPCGQVLRVTLDTDGARCAGCETQYGHGELFDLPLAERRAAA